MRSVLLDTNLFLTFLRNFVGPLRESHIPKEILIQNDTFVRLGVADASIAVKSKRVSCVFTTDLDLYLEISRANNTVVNFNHLRAQQYLS